MAACDRALFAPRRVWCGLLVVLALLLAAPAARGHKKHLSKSRWRIRPDVGLVGMSIGFEPSDLAIAADLTSEPLPAPEDAERDVEIRRRIFDGLAAWIRVTSGGKPCDARGLRIERRKGYVVGFRWDCGGPMADIGIDLAFLRRLPSDHRHIAALAYLGEQDVRRFDSTRTHFRRVFAGSSGVAAGTPDPLESTAEPGPLPEDEAAPVTGSRAFAANLWQGVDHIISGIDHILFLVALLAVGGTLRYLVTVITAFTVAHSITLAVAFLGLWMPPERLIECGIAASIVYVAAENCIAKSYKWRWAAVFGFGLLHGFGFAGFLTDLDLARQHLAATLFSFNLGVELGQLCIVLAVYPAMRWAATRIWHRPRVVVPLSALVGAAGLYWLVERAVG